MIMLSALQAAVDNLSDLREDHLLLMQRGLHADDRKLYSIDFLALAALNRSLSNIQGFAAAVGQDNYLLVNSILRLQLDTLLRFFSIHLVDNPHNMASAILHGKQIDKIKDRNGNKLTDRYLCEQFASREKLDWVSTVYTRSSGFIHLSNKHMLCIFTHRTEQPVDEKQFQIALGSGGGTAVSDETKVESIQCMEHITKLLLTYVYGWVRTKEKGAPPKAAQEVA